LFAELESALDESTKALAQAAEQREADHAAMSEAISAFCRVFGSDHVPSGSSPQSRLQALGDHARGRLREALHHGVRRAPCSLPTMTWIWSGSARGIAFPTKMKLPWPKSRGLTRPPRAQARCWRPPSKQRSSRLRRRPRPGRILPRVGTKPRVRLLLRATPDSARAVYFECICVFCGRRGPNTLLS
jgi:hypothetical protein